MAISRRGFLIASSAALMAADRRSIPVGLELYSVRNQLQKDLPGTLRAVAGMGYQIVEFFAPYYLWTPAYAADVRKMLDDLGLRCRSTHNDASTFTRAKLPKAIELNHALGTEYIVMSSAGKVANLDGWKQVAGVLSDTAERLKPAHLRTGYHNHEAEFRPIDGQRPIEVVARNTPPEVMLQLDVGTAIAAGADPVAWIKANPGRIRSVHCKDWAPSPNKGYRVLLGEGVADWPAIRHAAETVGGVQYYLIEQEGSRYPELETVKRCLAAWRKT
jgi:sugar phosphate isomerase/epimerase